MMRKASYTACFVIMLAAFGSIPGMSHGKGKKHEAKELFKEGVDLFEKGDFADALEKFKESFDLRSHWSVHYNMGLCYLELGQVPEGAMQLALYLEEGGDNVKSSVAKEVNARLMDLLPEVGTIVLYGELQGSSVKIDGQEKAGPTRKGEVYTPHGTFEFTFLREGKELFSREFAIERGEIKEVDIDEEVEAASRDREDTEETGEGTEEGSGNLGLSDFPQEEGEREVEEGGGGEPEKAPKVKRTWLWVAVGIAGGTLAAGTATGVMAVVERDAMRSDESTYRDLEGTVPAAELASIEKSRNEHFDKGKAYATATTVLLSVGAAAGIAGIVLLVLSGKAAEADKEVEEGAGEEDRKASFMLAPAGAGATFTVVY